MVDIVTRINNMMFEGAPLWDVIDACSVIDIESCFDPIFEPPLDFLEECHKRQWLHNLRSTPPLNVRLATHGISLKLNVMEMSRLPTR